jgi:hypothetical protein
MKKLSVYILTIVALVALSGGNIWAIGKRGGEHHTGGAKAHHQAKSHPQKHKAVAHHDPHKSPLHAQHAKAVEHHPHLTPHRPKEVHRHPKGFNPGGPVRGLHRPHNILKPTNHARLASVARNVRTEFTASHRNVFTPRWWQNRSITNITNIRWYPRWSAHRGPYYWWRSCKWVGLTGWLPGVAWSSPVTYDYGNNIYYQDDDVYVNGKRKYSADEYYQQVRTIAFNEPQGVSEKSEWMPLGVFALQRPTADSPHAILQLAISKEGAIAGTFYNVATEKTRPIHGTVNKQTQRAAWTVGNGADGKMVMETGAYNLTQDQTQVLVHLGPNNARKWLLVRMEAPKSNTSTSKL